MPGVPNNNPAGRGAVLRYFLGGGFTVGFTVGLGVGVGAGVIVLQGWGVG
jgi:hypothetical protein